ncbi:MAG: helix-turn-helix domain-containing protein [Anaerolineae bacterium]|nr:helix-turn-helix domain-containing protein [Anaerolineae bacterium]
MNKVKQSKLKKQGWRIGSVAEFLDLSPEEARLIEIKLVPSRALRKRRTGQMTQAELARRLESSQPRVAKAESGDRSVSMDLLVRALLATGATPREIAKEIARA